MYNNLLIVQARMSSTRLPGKSNMKLAGKTLVGHILERVKKSKLIDKIVLATSLKKIDDVLVDISKNENIECFRGSENDLLDRFYKCASKYKCKNVLRLPADNPFPEVSEYDRIIKYYLNSNYDFCSNICNFLGNSYPDGIGVEIFSYKSLKYIYNNQKSFTSNEHVALNYFDYINNKKNLNYNFKIGTIKCPNKFSRPDII